MKCHKLKSPALSRRRRKGGPAALLADQQQQQSTSSVSELEDDLEDSDSDEEGEPEIVEPPSPGEPGTARCLPSYIVSNGKDVRLSWLHWQ